MSKRQNEWAKRARLALIRELGGQCVYCGTREESELQIDHRKPIDWPHEHYSSSWRISLYRREAKAGLIQVACSWCNKSKGQRKAPQGRLLFA